MRQDVEGPLYPAFSQTPLRKFLTESMLSTRGKDEPGDTEVIDCFFAQNYGFNVF